MWPGTAASFAVTSSTRTNLRIFSDHMWEADAQPDNSGHNSRWDTPIVVSFSGTRRERALRVGVAGLATGCHRLRVTVRIMLVRYLDQRVPAWTGASVWLRYRHGCWRVRWRTCDAGRHRRIASSGLPSANRGRRNREERRLSARGNAGQFLKRGISTAAAKSIEGQTARSRRPSRGRA